MSRSSLLRAADNRAVYQLVGECRELGDDPAEWRRHLLAEITRLTGSAVSLEIEGEFLDPFRATGRAEWGWETSGLDRPVFLSIQEELARRGGGFIPMVPAYLASRHAGLAPCLSRKDVLADAQWYRSRYYQNYHVPSGVNHIMYCIFPKPGPGGKLSALTLVRPLQERRDFSARQKGIVQELHEKITAMICGPLAGFHEPSPAQLPPRVRQLLRCLLEGDSDKQAACRLGLGRHTINQYAKTIFVHFGMGSRAELLARWLRRGWGNRCAWADSVPYLHGAQTFPPNPSPADLPPRVRQTFRCLLEGDSDKQIAARLGLGRHTINQYAKTIFAHFGVRSRAELLARWLRPGWGNEYALAQPTADEQE
ncbi:MAG TPA: helix-turn-helix transcriptional regulator [Gemmataceae bacterium]|nr:helix-turn-helix transcriptional regulator [Gemmataceae bacterium]